MKKIVIFPHRAVIEDEAATWLVKIDAGKLSKGDEQALKNWLQASARHRSVLRHMAQLWGGMDGLSVLAQMFPLQADANEIERERNQLKDRRYHWGMGVAALLCVVVFGVLWYPPFFTGEQFIPALKEPVELVHQTERGKQSTVKLLDGSVMTLNTQSEVRVRYDSLERAVYLVKGEVHFDVTKDIDRPFVVYAGNGYVRAVGTAFSVRLKNGTVDVAVDEGVVEVVAGVDQASVSLKTLQLSEGGVANYAESIEQVDYIEPEKLVQRLAWKSGKWIFQGQTLSEVIDEASRYSSRTIEIVDPAIAELRVGGYFRVGDVDALLDVLQTSFAIKVIYLDEQTIQLAALSPLEE